MQTEKDLKFETLCFNQNTLVKRLNDDKVMIR